MSRNYVLLTGSTGFIGQYLLHNLLEQGRQVAVLVREKHGIAPHQRVERLLQEWESRLQVELPRPYCLAGDIRHDFFGLDSRDVAWVRRHVGSMIHNAALVEFGVRGPTIWETNVDGTEHCVRLCRTAEIDHLHYVSTAYVSGTRSGTILEDELDLGQTFHNEYERSKFEAERIVRSSFSSDRLTVYRPSVVIGDSRDGFATCYRGLYVLAQFTHVVAQQAARDSDGRWHHPLRIGKTGDERRNVVPVDWVARVIADVFQDPRLHGRTYHIAPGKPTTVAQIEEALRGYFGYHGVELTGADGGDASSRSDVERLFYSYLERYMPYWDDDPVFDISNTRSAMSHRREPAVGVADLTRMIDFAVRDRFGKRRRARRLLVS